MTGTSAQDAARDDWRRRQYDLPRTSTAGLDTAGSESRVFDPALKHFADGYRITDSAVDGALRPAWRAARRSALDVVARGVARSGWADSLVLRGSMLMAGWFGAAAREPHDLDFVVVPRDWAIEEPRTGQLLAAVAQSAERSAAEQGGLVMPAAGAVSEDIWTYERVPGRRLVLPWSAPGLPGARSSWTSSSTSASRRSRSRRRRGRAPAGGHAGAVAGLEAGLAGHGHVPAGQGPVRRGPARRALHGPVRADPHGLPGVGRVHPLTLEAFSEVKWADWDAFRADYPGISGSAASHAERLLTALGPTFDRWR